MKSFKEILEYEGNLNVGVLIELLEKLPNDYQIVCSETKTINEKEEYDARLDKPISHMYLDDDNKEVVIFSTQNPIDPNRIGVDKRIW